MKLSLPDPCLVVLIGPSGAGKSSFARAHFKPTEVLSSDTCRGLVSDDDNDQSCSAEAFAVLEYIAAKRLAAGRLTVIDATNVQPEARKPLVKLAREHDLFAVAVVLDLPEKVCLARNRERAGREFGAHVIRGQVRALRRSLRNLRDEGFRHTVVIDSAEKANGVTIERTPLWTNQSSDHGPFDIIGDVHGCMDELELLLARLGYSLSRGEEHPYGVRVAHPQGRRVIFLGDLVDRGPRSTDVLRAAMSMLETGSALWVPGNHEARLLRKLRGRDVKPTHGLAETLQQLEREPPEFKARVAEVLDGLVSHFVLDGGELVVAHAGMKAEYQGRASSRVKEFALFGETTGETDEFGLPVRGDWQEQYRGRAMVVHGHTPVREPEWVNRTIDLDTGCVFGGSLTALRYPERELVSVPAAEVYYEPAKPIVSPIELEAGRGHLLDLDDVNGRSAIQTGLHGRVTIRQENASAALEAMSRFAIDPRWLVYLPPTMSPAETSQLPGLLEHPDEAFEYYRREGVSQVICEEKHMGSRAVVVLCRDEAVARERFGEGGRIGVVYTRTGRPFFRDEAVSRAFLDRTRAAVQKAGLWEELETGWLCLDCELMPWSAKAMDLLRHQYAPVGAAARTALSAAIPALREATREGRETAGLLARFESRAESASKYVDAYRRYCWPVEGLDGVKVAPFHLLASEGRTHLDRAHLWHMSTLARLAETDGGLFLATAHQLVDLADADSLSAAIGWWESMTARGGEGMVVKPSSFVARGRRGLIQPAVKVRGREYLRIIYGPEYSAPEHLERLRSRGLSAKRSLALREFALGAEALERFVQREPLYRVHQCVFGVLALESEPIDPRL